MNIRKVIGRRVVRGGVLVATVLAMRVAPAAATQVGTDGQQEHLVKTLGGSTRFSQPMRNVDDLHAMATANRSQFGRVLTLAGLGHISTQVIDALTVGAVTDATIVPGTHLEWMALKRSGTPGVLQNVRWAGRQSFDAFQFIVNAGGSTYTFVVPKICGNLSLVNTVANAAPAVVAVPRAVEPPPPPPPPPPPIAEAPPQAPPPPPPPAQVAIVAVETTPSWRASGFLGTSFGTADSDAGQSLTFGGQIGYMWRARFGGEFLADFAPSVDLVGLNLDVSPNENVNSYMINAVGILRGHNQSYEPYISGGFGRIALRTDRFTLLSALTNVDTTTVSRGTFGGNLGAGFMYFRDRVGFRTDVRYYKASTSNSFDSFTGDGIAGALAQEELSGLRYWRANAGISFRW